MDIKPIDILLVEDNPGDILLTRKAFEKSRVVNKLFVVETGDDAISYLRKERAFSSAVRPDLILLDLNLPGKSGREVLKEIKTDDYLKKIPVIILTTSKDEVDIVRSYTDAANCYITKPIDIKDFFEVIHSIEDFWLSIVKLPSGKKK